MDKQKHGKKEKLSIKKVLLDYFVNLLTIKTQIKKSFSLYSYNRIPPHSLK